MSEVITWGHPKILLNESKAIKLGLHDLFTVSKQLFTANGGVLNQKLKHYDQQFDPETQSLGKLFNELGRDIHDFQLNLSYESNDMRPCNLIKYKSQYPDKFDQASFSALLMNPASYDLWNTLEGQYYRLLRQSMTDSVEDTIWLSASRQWAHELSDWRQRFSCFENEVHSRVQAWSSSENFTKMNRHHDASIGKQFIGQQIVEGSSDMLAISSNDRLILNLFKRIPSLDTLHKQNVFSDIMQLSLAALRETAPEIQDSVKELWEILKAIYVPEVPVKDITIDWIRGCLRKALNWLRVMCRSQILSLIKARPEQAFEKQNLFTYLRRFTMDNFDESQFKSNEFVDKLWQLLYWCYRCGSPEALGSFETMIEQELQQVNSTNHYQFYLMANMASILRSQLTQLDLPSYDQFSNQEESTSYQNYTKLQAEFTPVLETNPIFILLSFCIKQGICNFNDHSLDSMIGLRELMPDATAEDYLWYHFTLMSSKQDDQLLSELTGLQNKVLDSGPEHFHLLGSTPPAFAKITALSLQFTAATDWILKDRPELAITCIYWLTYLFYIRYSGSDHCMISKFFFHLKGTIGAKSLAAAYKKILSSNVELPSAVQLTEMLPFQERVDVLTQLFEWRYGAIFADQGLMDRVIGKVQDDGACLGGLLLKALLAECCIGINPKREQAQQVFEEIVSSLIEIAVHQQNYITIIQLAYLISRDKIALKHIYLAMCLGKIYPHQGEPTLSQSDQQLYVEKFYSFFQKRCHDETTDDLVHVLKLVDTAYYVCSKICRAASLQKYAEAWKLIIEKNLSPTTDLINRWKNTALIQLIPQLIEVSIECLAHQNTKMNSNIKKTAELLVQAIIYLAATPGLPSVSPAAYEKAQQIIAS